MITEKKYVYDFQEYKAYLLYLTGGKEIRRGVKAQLAEVADCQPTYISQVLHGSAHLSFEQAERLSRHFNHTPDETQYFLILLSLDRAGSKQLKEHYRQQIRQITERRLNVVNRLGEKNTLNDEQRATFYSSWQYLAIHISLTVPELQTREAISTYFQIALKRVDQILDFLFQAGLATKDKSGRIQSTTNEIRLGKDSPHIYRHHAHWRQQAIESLEREEVSDLHYSGVFSLSHNDVLSLKERLLESIKSSVQIVKDSKEEQVYVFNVDFFNLKKAST